MSPFDGSLEASSIRGDPRGQEGKYVQVIIVVFHSVKQVCWSGCLGLHQLSRLAADGADLGFPVYQVNLKLAAPPAKGHIMVVWFGDRRRPDQVEGDPFYIQVSDEG